MNDLSDERDALRATLERVRAVAHEIRGAVQYQLNAYSANEVMGFIDTIVDAAILDTTGAGE